PASSPPSWATDGPCAAPGPDADAPGRGGDSYQPPPHQGRRPRKPDIDPAGERARPLATAAHGELTPRTIPLPAAGGQPRSGTLEVVDLHAGRGDGQRAGRGVERRLPGTHPLRLSKRILRIRTGAGELPA